MVKENIKIEGVKRFYVFCDSGGSGTQPSTGTVMTSSSDTGATTLGSIFTNAGTCIAVTVDLTTATQGEILNELRTAITHANGHNGTLRCGNAHNASNSVDFNADGTLKETLFGIKPKMTAENEVVFKFNINIKKNKNFLIM